MSPPNAFASSPHAAGGAARWVLRAILWLVTPGGAHPTPADRLRGWSRYLVWRQADRAQRTRLLRRAVWMAVRARREAAWVVERHGRRIEDDGGPPMAEQRRQVAAIVRRHGLPGLAYPRLALHRPDRGPRAGEYSQADEYFHVVRWYNRQHPDSDAPVLMDKLRYADWCASHELPTVPALLEFDRGELRPGLIATAEELPDRDLFSKPTEGTGGHGTSRWRHSRQAGMSVWTGTDGRPRTGAELLTELAELSCTLDGKYGRSAHRMLLQPCLHNHRALASITTSAASTVRIVTIRTPGGRARAAVATFRMATGDVPVDNISAGGIAAPVDLATGRLGAAMRMDGDAVVPVERHPDTGGVIAGVALPHWREAVAHAERGLDAARRLPSIGWDIALTDDGPVMIEANPASNPRIAQFASGVPLSATGIPDAIDMHLRDHFGLPRLPEHSAPSGRTPGA